MELISPSDAADLAAIHRSAFDDAWNAPAFEALLASPGVFGIRKGDAGFILSRAAADEAEILTLAVRPEERRAGLGAALLAAATEWAEGLGCAALFLEVAEDNPAALALYRSAAFAEVGLRRAYYARPRGAVAALVMRRDLNR